MKNIERPLMAFLIPFVSAFLLLYCEKYFFVPDETEVKFGLSDYIMPVQERIYDGLIFCLFLLALLLPAFVAFRAEPIERNEITLKDI